MWTFNGWCWVIAILRYGKKLLSFNHKFLKLSNELVLPFYVLHGTVITMVSFYVLNMDLILILKYLAIVLASLGMIIILLLPIRQINILRLLFGMKLKK